MPNYTSGGRTTSVKDLVGEVAEWRLSRHRAVFVLSARKFHTEGDRISLEGIPAATLFVTDERERRIGHLRTRDFLAAWRDEPAGFADEPPTAVLSFFDPILDPGEPPPGDVAVVLREAELRGDSVVFSVDVVEGEIPRETGGCSLFIDVTGRSSLPSVSWVHFHPVRAT